MGLAFKSQEPVYCIIEPAKCLDWAYVVTWLLKIWLTNIDPVLKTNPWTYEIEDINGEKIIWSFYEKELLLSKLWMSYYPEPDSHIREKSK